ncbi:hypothetical protein OL239_11910 [Arthrobacter sp. ATA002]|uniref:hypothetical protein n=1 Tax=Arthrobacter sp. ATA002 TaxID=2991715 RepID=UPI0022A6695C|nr:hypothetical protein [Arthrobacter sp. ATA002]WAP50727.1 hypothetical protein OL239_11910 [Arthrobacter sp. ATA002]
MTAVVLEPTSILDAAGPCQLHLRSGGVSVLLDLSENQLPSVAHWGAELPGLDATEAAVLVDAALPHLFANGPDVPLRLDLLGSLHTAWTGTPGLAGDRGGRDWSPCSAYAKPGLNRRRRTGCKQKDPSPVPERPACRLPPKMSRPDCRSCSNWSWRRRACCVRGRS